jgi:hypothetical protein
MSVAVERRDECSGGEGSGYQAGRDREADRERVLGGDHAGERAVLRSGGREVSRAQLRLQARPASVCDRTPGRYGTSAVSTRPARLGATVRKKSRDI